MYIIDQIHQFSNEPKKRFFPFNSDRVEYKFLAHALLELAFQNTL
jgi:hypothetical protein